MIKKDMGPELVPGSTYKYNNTYVYFFIGFNAKGKAVFDFGGNSFVLDDDLRHRLKEYKEPKRGTVWVNILGSNGTWGEAWFSKEGADRNARDRLACIEVPWVEGQGLG